MVNNDESVNTTPTSPNIDIRCIYIFADLKILLNLFGMVGRCPECNSGIDVVIDFAHKKGLAQNIDMNCDGGTDCECHYSTYLSETVKVGEHKRFDVNVRSIVAFREIGKGITHLKKFNRLMNMSPPLSQSNYQEMLNDELLYGSNERFVTSGSS